MKYLAELQETVKYLTEGEGSDKKHYISGLFLEFDKPNKNNRIYSSKFHDPTVNNYIKERINEKRAWGELDHPDGATINLKQASHRIVELHKDNNNWIGKAIITNTPNGNIVKGLLESGGNLGVSSRGLGSLKQCEGYLEVQPDYKIITAADVVSDPSAHGAFVAGIMENVEYLWDEKLGWISEEVKKKVKKMSIKEIEEKKTKIFEKYLITLKNSI
jgi:hypothetical protein